MTKTAKPKWESKRTKETRLVERVLKEAGFQQVDAYRYNPASIRVRVIDPRFTGLSVEKRDAMVEPVLDKLPEQTRADIISLYTFAPEELAPPPTSFKEYFLNIEFDDPSPSML